VVRIVSFASTLLVAGGLAVSSIGFAGLAAAEPACQGGVPNASAHQLFPDPTGGPGPASSGSCADAFDLSDTSMVDIAVAGSYPSGSSYPNGSSALTSSSWTKVN
jgi:hypothetical protein